MAERGVRHVTGWIGGGLLAVGAVLGFLLLTTGAASAEEPTTGSITIVVDASPNDAQDFTFSGCQGAGCSTFLLDDDADPTRTSTLTGTDLPPATYTLTQAAVPNWTLASLTCDTGETVDLAGRRATVALTAGEHVTCTFNNTSASITIRQASSPADAHDFSYTGCQGVGCSTFLLDDDTNPALPDRVSAAGLAPGTYVITQALDADWALTSLTCTTGEAVSLANRQVTITLTAGEQTSCTFTDRAPSITVVQDSAPDAAQDFAFTGCLGAGCSSFVLDDDADPAVPSTVTGAAIPAGTYTITQAPGPVTWPLSSLTCTTNELREVNARRVTITLSRGEQTSCTFKNTQDTRPGTLTLVADGTPDGPQDVVLHRCVDDACTDVTLDDDRDPAHPRTSGPQSLAPGVYTVRADAIDGRELSEIACTSPETVDLDARTVSVRLTPAETQTCTFAHRPPQPALTGVGQISVGLDHTCALVTGGQARCWGIDQDGAPLGDGGFDDATTPVVVEEPDGSGPMTGVRSISAGFAHTCVALTSGQARCWGYNNDDGVGDGTTAVRTRPVTVVGTSGSGPLTDVAEVVAAAGYSCARLTTGQARCWGANGVGQLGDGTTTDRTRPVVASDPAGSGPLTEVAQIVGGTSHTCARLTSGQVRCWGANTDGRLGDGTTTDALRPVVVSNPAGTGPLTGVTHLAVGYFQTCAALDDGRAVCWGTNSNGQLGDGTTTARTRPVAVSNPDGTGPLTGVTSMAAGATQTCARTETGRAYCWGVNEAGGIGEGTAEEHHRPVAVVDVGGTGPLTGVAELSGGLRHTCARLAVGEVRCWGRNLDGELGDGTTATRLRPVPTIDPSRALRPLSGVTQLSTGNVHSCARLTNGEARCWGSTALGNPDLAESLVAAPVTDVDGAGPLTGVVQVAAGTRHTCALRDDTGVVCWGANDAGQVGDGTTTDRVLPTPVLDETGTAPLSGVLQIDAGVDQTCAVLSDHQARCWGAGYRGDGLGTGGDRRLPVVVAAVAGTDGPLTGVAQISVGDTRSCAALTSGQARCWGYSPGDGSTTPPSMEPVVVSNPEGTGPLTDVAAVEAGGPGSCAVLGSGEARCWGSGVGDGTGTHRSRPVAVKDAGGTAPLTGVTTIRWGDDHACAALSSGQARCWGGNNQFGQLGAPPPAPASSLPLAVQDPSDGGTMTSATEVTPGRLETCVRRTDGQVRCWGANAWHSLGNGTTRTRYLPTPVLAPAS